MKIYLAGKMRGLPNFNYQAFTYWAAKIRDRGHLVFSPVEATMAIYGADVYRGNPEGDEGKTPIDPNKVFFNDLAYICLHADAVALIPGWETSSGSRAEKAVAEALGKEVIILNDELFK